MWYKFGIWLYWNVFLQLLCHASYPDGVSGGLTRNGKGKPPLETSLSCPSEPAAQPKYRGGRKKEAPPANMTAEQRVQWEKERQKKDNHNDSTTKQIRLPSGATVMHIALLCIKFTHSYIIRNDLCRWNFEVVEYVFRAITSSSIVCRSRTQEARQD